MSTCCRSLLQAFAAHGTLGESVAEQEEAMSAVQVSTRILGRRTAPFPPFLIYNRVPHGFTQDPSTKLRVGLPCPAERREGRAGLAQRVVHGGPRPVPAVELFSYQDRHMFSFRIIEARPLDSYQY